MPHSHPQQAGCQSPNSSFERVDDPWRLFMSQNRSDPKEMAGGGLFAARIARRAKAIVPLNVG
jgi:hypothetical protein